jgi:hypothetical protein
MWFSTTRALSLVSRFPVSLTSVFKSGVGAIPKAVLHFRRACVEIVVARDRRQSALKTMRGHSFGSINDAGKVRCHHRNEVHRFSAMRVRSSGVIRGHTAYEKSPTARVSSRAAWDNRQIADMLCISTEWHVVVPESKRAEDDPHAPVNRERQKKQTKLFQRLMIASLFTVHQKGLNRPVKKWGPPQTLMTFSFTHHEK